MALSFRTAYWHDLAARRAFIAAMVEIFGLDFSAWDAAGYWDDAYRPFSLFDGEKMVANVCIYLLDMMLDGRPARLAQVSGVGTLPAYRRRGLGRQLLNAGLDWAQGRHEGMFLFADDEAISLYEGCGFHAQPEFCEQIDVQPVARRAGARRLDLADPTRRQRLYALAQRRVPVSQRFGVLNARLLMFHALYRLRDCAVEIPALDCVVFARRQGDRLTVFDIVAERLPDWQALYPYLAQPGDRSIEFRFGADRLGLGPVHHSPLLGNNCHVREGFPFARPVFPFTVQA